MFNVFKWLKISRKKTIYYKERNETKRQEFLNQIASFPKDPLVFVDPFMVMLQANDFTEESLIATKRSSEVLSPYVFQETCYTKLFEMWIEKFLVFELKPGQAVIMDSATFHKSKKTQELIEKAQCKLIFLPPYSPALNPLSNRGCVTNSLERQVTLKDLILI